MDEFGAYGVPEFDPANVVSSEVIERERTTNERTIARQAALQVLYEVDSADHKVGDVVNALIDDNPMSSRSIRYMRKLVSGIVAVWGDLDQTLQQYAPEWPLDQVAIVDRNVLRLALFELAFRENVPVKVVIDEAVQLAGLFGADGSMRFVNGVLGSLVNDVDKIRQTLGSQDLT